MVRGLPIAMTNCSAHEKSNIKSEMRMHITDKHLEEYTRIVTTEIKPNTERLHKQNQCQISHQRLSVK